MPLTIYAVTMYDYYDYRHYYEDFYANADRAWFEYTASVIHDAHNSGDFGHEWDVEEIEVIQ